MIKMSENKRKNVFFSEDWFTKEQISEYQKPTINTAEPEEFAVPAMAAVALVGGYVGGFVGQALTNMMK